MTDCGQCRPLVAIRTMLQSIRSSTWLTPMALMGLLDFRLSVAMDAVRLGQTLPDATNEGKQALWKMTIDHR